MLWINRLAWLDKSYGVYNSTYVRWKVLSWHPCSNLVHGNFVPVIPLWKKYKLQSICLFNHNWWNINKKTGLKLSTNEAKKGTILPLPPFHVNVESVNTRFILKYALFAPEEILCDPAMKCQFLMLHKIDYPASDRNLEIWLAETNTICSDIMLPY